MPPQQIPNVSAPSSGNQYDFIVNYNHRPGSNWLLQSSLKTRIIIFSGGLLVLLLLAWIFIALLSANSGTSATSLTALAQEQAELARVANSPQQNTNLDATLNLASTVRLSMLSDEQTFVNYLTSINAGPSSDTLAQDMNAQTDAQLSSAKTNGTFDQTYTTVTNQELTTYANNLKKAFNATSNPSERQLLNNAYQNAQLLVALSSSNS